MYVGAACRIAVDPVDTQLSAPMLELPIFELEATVCTDRGLCSWVGPLSRCEVAVPLVCALVAMLLAKRTLRSQSGARLAAVPLMGMLAAAIALAGVRQLSFFAVTLRMRLVMEASYGHLASGHAHGT